MIRLWESKEDWKTEKAGREVRGVIPQTKKRTVSELFSIVLFIVLLFSSISSQIVLGENLLSPTFTYTTATPIQDIDMPSTGDFIVIGTSTSEKSEIYGLSLNGTLRWRYQISSWVSGISVSPDGRYIAVGSKGGLYILNRDGQLTNKLIPPEIAGSPENAFHAVTISPRSKYIATECNGVIILYNITGELLWDYPDIRGYVTEKGIAFSKSEKYIAVGFYELGVYLFDITGHLIWKVPIPQNVRVVKFINDDLVVVGTSTSNYSSGHIYVFNTTGNLVWDYKTQGGVSSISISNDGNYIAVGTEKSGLGIVYLFTKKGQLQWSYDTGNPVNDVAVSENGSLIVSGGGSGVYLFDIEGNVVDSYHLTFSVHSLAISPEMKHIAFGTSNKVYYVSLSKEVSYEKTKNTTANLSLDSGYLTVYSDPPKARVYIDGNYVGDTPLENYMLPTGQHSLKASKTGYHSYNTTVTINPNKTTVVNVQLNAQLATLIINSNPLGAGVYINGTYHGITPLTLNLTPGTYELKVVEEGYQNFTKIVTINPGEKTNITASLILIKPQTTIPSQTTSSTSSTTTITSESSGGRDSPALTQTAQTATGGGIPKTYLLTGLIVLGIIGAALKMRDKSKERQSAVEKPKPPLKKERAKLAKAPLQSSSKKPAPVPVPEKREKTESTTSSLIPGFPVELLSRYEPLKFLGEGGFAKVFKVKRKKDGKVVALKIPRIDERTSKTFIREVSTWLHLNHPNIVKLYDVDILPVPYLEMEYIEGAKVGDKVVRDLDKYPKPVDEKRALKLIKGIVEGLKYAHSKGIYHRDLKPLNILLKSDLTPKITDWGLAKIGTATSGRMSSAGYSPLYAAPEQLMPSKYGNTDARTDIWQLGVTFYELLTGRLPFEGYTYEEVFGKIVDENYKFIPPSKIDPELSKYDAIFEKLLAKKKEARYQSVDEFFKDLEKLSKAEKRKAELEKEVEELKKSLAKSMEALKQSKTADEVLKNRRMVVEALGKLALAYAELNRKAELLNALNDLKFYTVQNVTDLTNAISTVEALIKEDLPISEDFVERLKVLVHSIKRENGG
ncbi:PEGA domain-containing protein [Thermococcus sp. M39]|uniref:DUF5711 family protein n=1 Tax=Thermococcus sp. M39 TaxID=1638262 RepID=UPI00143A000A|nr:PEGA domain-containing protein [Thermococcus sp. M39]NJE08484.1 PEGA domain-containing protein [Thermococcus sp. M39]